MDLSELGLSEEQLKGVEDYAAGLKAKNDELLGEKKTMQQKALEASEAAELARAQAVKAEEERLKLTGDMDGLKAHYEEQLASKIAEANSAAETARSALTERDKGAVINSILSGVDDRYKSFVETQLKNSVAISYDEAGKAITTIQDGDAKYASPSDFINGVKESETWKHVLKATSLSGAGTKQSVNNSNINNPGDWSKMSTEQKAEHLRNNPPQRK